VAETSGRKFRLLRSAALSVLPTCLSRGNSKRFADDASELRAVVLHCVKLPVLQAQAYDGDIGEETISAVVETCLRECNRAATTTVMACPLLEELFCDLLSAQPHFACLLIQCLLDKLLLEQQRNCGSGAAGAQRGKRKRNGGAEAESTLAAGILARLAAASGRHSAALLAVFTPDMLLALHASGQPSGVCRHVLQTITLCAESGTLDPRDAFDALLFVADGDCVPQFDAVTRGKSMIHAASIAVTAGPTALSRLIMAVTKCLEQRRWHCFGKTLKVMQHRW
jgi:hypothetical protein